MATLALRAALGLFCVAERAGVDLLALVAPDAPQVVRVAMVVEASWLEGCCGVAGALCGSETRDASTGSFCPAGLSPDNFEDSFAGRLPLMDATVSISFLARVYFYEDGEAY